MTDRSMRAARWLLALLLVCLPFTRASSAAVPAFGVIVTNLVAEPGFTALVSVESPALQQPVELAVSRLRERVRLDFDLRQWQQAMDSLIPAGLLSRLGVARGTAFGRLDQESPWQILFGGVNGYYEERWRTDDPALRLFAAGGQLERAVLGREAIGGQSCAKVRLTVVKGSQRKTLGTAWQSAALKDFPVRVELQLADGRTTLRFRDVKFGRIDSKLLAVPAGAQRYDDARSLLLAAVRKQAPFGWGE